MIQNSAAASRSLGTLGSQSRVIENQPKSGVPFILHLGYINGSIPTTGQLKYTVRFSFNEPFKILGVSKGTFDDAMVLNKTAVLFQSSSIFKLQNKTGLVLFSFHNGLAEKHRIVTTLTHNVTLSIPSSLLPYEQPSGSDTPQASPPVGIISTDNATGTLTASQSLQTGPLSASIVDLAVGITDLGDKVFGLAKEAYSATTPCASVSGEYVGEKTSHVGSLVQYLVGVNNCSAHPELMSISTVVPQGIKTSLETDRFDSEAHSMKKLSMFVIIPVNHLAGIYTFKIDGKVLFNFFGTLYVVSETIGNTSPPLILTP